MRCTGMRRLAVGFFVALGLACVACALAVPRARSQPTRIDRIDRLEVDKSEHTLVAFSGGRRVGVFPVAVGRGGLGDKGYEGDRITPIGDYRIDRRHRSRRFHRFLHVSYPNAADRARYRIARRRGAVPTGRGIGGDIGIHGESDRRVVRMFRNRIDWTDGCIAVRDEVAARLYREARPGAAIAIRD